MEELSFKIAVISLLFSLVALVWNITRDIFMDKVKLNVNLFLGAEITDDQGMKRGISAGSKISINGIEKTILAERVFFDIANIGRRDIEVDCIRADYEAGGWYLPINGKRYLKPYESISVMTPNSELKDNLVNRKVKSIYVVDTKKKKWNFSDEDMEKAVENLKITVDTRVE